MIDSLWHEPRRAWLSIQVLQELFVNLVKVIPPEEAEGVTKDFLRWNVVVNDRTLLSKALETRRSFRISFWDALVLAAALRCGARTLLSEDFTHGRTYGTVRAVNPFLGRSDEAS